MSTKKQSQLTVECSFEKELTEARFKLHSIGPAWLKINTGT